MDGADTLVNALDISALDVATQVSIAFYGTLVAFFVVAPLLGALLATRMKKNPNAWIVASSALLILILVSVGMSYGLRVLIPAERMSDLAVTAVSAFTAIALSGLIASYLTWHFSEGGGLLAKEFDAMADEELAPFDRRRRAVMERRRQRRG